MGHALLFPSTQSTVRRCRSNVPQRRWGSGPRIPLVPGPDAEGRPTVLPVLSHRWCRESELTVLHSPSLLCMVDVTHHHPGDYGKWKQTQRAKKKDEKRR